MKTDRHRHWRSAFAWFSVIAGVIAGQASAAQAASRPEFGVRAGPGCQGRKELPRFENFAGRKVDRVVDALNQSDWPQLESSIAWASKCWAGAPVKLTLSVPMLVEKGPGTLADGANGKFDRIFLKTAKTMVANGQSRAIVRIGWEFNGNWMPWAASKDPKNFIAYYRRIVRLMRSVPGQDFEFEWTPGVGRQSFPPDQGYPGDDVVDVIGMDIYNEYWSPALANNRVRFAWYMNQPYGLRWHREFAAQHRKPMAYSEWGSGTRTDGHGAGDDAHFFEQMGDWFATNNVLYQSYWETAGYQYDDRISRGKHPLAAEAYRRFVANR